jgi:di/tricarboxylate transporter
VAIAFVSALLLVAVVLFVLDRWTIDVVTVMVLLALVFGGILTPEEAFAGFASEILIALAALFVVTGTLQDTGAAHTTAARVVRRLPRSEGGVVAALMGIVASLSSVMNNTTVTGLLVGPVGELAKRTNLSPSRVMMPLAFASMIGGTCTLIGTSTNIAVSGAMPKHGLEPLGFFELTPLGVVLVVVGCAWMALVGRHMLQKRAAAAASAGSPSGTFVTEVVLTPGSPLAGKRIAELGFLARIRVLRVVRDGDELQARSGRKLREGDVLQCVCDAATLLEVKATPGLEILPETEYGDDAKHLDHQLLAEAVVLPDSPLAGVTIRDAALYDESGAVVIGLHRRGAPVRGPLGDIALRVGDVLLLQGRAESMQQTRELFGLAFTDAAVDTSRLRRGRVWVVVLGFIAAIVASTAGLAPLSVSFLAAAVIAVVSGCVHPERALLHVPWRLLILIGGMTAFGVAVQKTGADQFYASKVVEWLAPYGPLPVLAGFMLLTMALSQAMSNAAAALVVLPVAIATAAKLDLQARPFAIGIMVASSLALATPFEPSSVIVFGPGRYRFRDYFVVGLPISLLLLAVTLVLLPWLWPLR